MKFIILLDVLCKVHVHVCGLQPILISIANIYNFTRYHTILFPPLTKTVTARELWQSSITNM